MNSRRSSAGRPGTGTVPRRQPSRRSPGLRQCRPRRRSTDQVGPMDLNRHPLGPGPEGPLAADRDARIEQEGASGAGARLGEQLRGRLAEREASIDELGRQVFGVRAPRSRSASNRALRRRPCLRRWSRRSDHRADPARGPCVRRPKLVGEGADSRRQALRVVEEQDFGHETSGGSRVSRSRGIDPT